MAETGAQDEIRAVLDQLLEAQHTCDAERVRSLLSKRSCPVHIGTDAEEWWTSEQIVDAAAAVGSADEIQVVADDIDIHVEGDVAWAEEHRRFTTVGGGERPAQMTAVLVRENDPRKVVQSQLSIAVPNAISSVSTRSTA